MAFSTLQRSMNASKREARARVMKARALPEVLTMAFPAVRKHTAVNVIFLVTLVAVLGLTSKFSSVTMTFVTVHCEVNTL